MARDAHAFRLTTLLGSGCFATTLSSENFINAIGAGHQLAGSGVKQ